MHGKRKGFSCLCIVTFCHNWSPFSLISLVCMHVQVTCLWSTFAPLSKDKDKELLFKMAALRRRVVRPFHVLLSCISNLRWEREPYSMYKMSVVWGTLQWAPDGSCFHCCMTYVNRVSHEDFVFHATAHQGKLLHFHWRTNGKRDCLKLNDNASKSNLNGTFVLCKEWSRSRS